eukprot:Plantae.Rhodophyta-Hildenbrandia_rubra.ctg27848.p1 GENE.Plantae.Rhodophyta-Hildenbrandia_rubra.ctg27848~~Plantae.Rhodophyta-Hildenbrandia_rubra.ctg27848.p1  ORF type:complete len:381 (+),score=44.01 Plantae.Rhodophyta-Hildenbrandia_rubra.ctg27848:544-1686(+)
MRVLSKLALSCSLVLSIGVTTAIKPPRDPTCASLLPAYLASLDAGRTPKPLPVAPANFPPSEGDVGYNLEQVRPGVHRVYSNGYISLIILKGRHLVLIDFPDPIPRGPPSNTSVVASAAIEILNGTKPSKIDMVYSHSHFDHIGKASLTKTILKDKFPSAKFDIWASKGTARSLALSKSRKAPFPNQIFKESVVLYVGNRGQRMPILLKVIGGHTEDDVFAYLKPWKGQKGVLFAVDLGAAGWAPFFFLDLTQNLNQYLAAQDRLMQFDFDVFVGGHVSRTGTKRDIAINKQYLLSVIESARKAIPSATQFPVVGQQLGIFDPKSSSFGNFFAAIGDFYKGVDKVCAREVIEEWGCRLAGADAVAESCCTAARLYVEIDI